MSRLNALWIGVVAFFTIAILTDSVARAQPSPPAETPSAEPASPPPAEAPSAKPASPPPPAEDAKDTSKAKAAEHFKRGRELFQKESYAAALAEFLQSIELYPSWSATSHAAVSLKALQRFDEALDRFETLLDNFKATLSPAAKSAAQEQVIELRKLTATITIEDAERGATITVDGRRRGEYPSPDPLTVLAGSHVVRVYKEGFEPFEKSVDLAPGQSARISARLHALVRSGRLAVRERKGMELDVIVDGFTVGKTPWEGPVAVGAHAVMLAGSESFGTLPAQTSVRLGQKTELELSAEDLGASIRVVPAPGGASVAVDGIFVGRGVFDGRLRPGEHVIKVVADGYFSQIRKITLGPGGRVVSPFKLERDPDSPLWARPGRFTFEVAVGLPIARTFGGDIAASCSGACSQGVGVGGMGAFHGGYELGNGFGFGVSAGYLSAAQTTSERPAALDTVGSSSARAGSVEDAISIHGFLAGAFGAIRLGDRYPLRLRLGAGALIGSISDVRAGRFEGIEAGTRIAYNVGPNIESPAASWLFLSPEIRAGMRVGSALEISAGLGALLLVTPSPPKWDREHPIDADSDGYGRFKAESMTNSTVFMLLPSIMARYEL